MFELCLLLLEGLNSQRQNALVSLPISSKYSYFGLKTSAPVPSAVEDLWVYQVIN